MIAYAESLLCIVRNQEQTINIMRGEANNSQTCIYNLEQRVKLAESAVETSQDMTCCICMDAPREMVYINCGHFCVCAICRNRIDEECPICRTSGRAIKIIYS